VNVPKLRLPQAALLFAVTSFLHAETIVREARWLIPKGEPLLVREFGKLAVVHSQWKSSGDLKLDQASGAMILRSKEEDPFIETALPAGTRGPLLVILRCRANTYDTAQLFWRGDKQGYASTRSTSVPLYPTDDFADFTFHLDTNATLTHLRLDPFPADGSLSVQRLTVSRIDLGSPSNSRTHITPPSGDTIIRSPALGSEIVVTTTSRLAGAIHSIKWNDKEFIDSHDHGRQLQSASNFDADSRFHPETFNPTEAGSRNDGAGSASTSRLLRIAYNKNSLSTTNRMAFWIAPGQFSSENLAKNKTLLSRHILKKNLHIGYRKFQSVISYDVTFSVPPGENHRYAQFEVLTGYMPAEFSKFWKFVPESGKLAPLSDGPGEQPFPVVLSTPNGSHAMTCIPRESPSENFEGPGYGRFRFLENLNKTVKWNIVYRLQNKQGILPANYPFRLFVVVGDLETIRSTLVQLGLPQAR
jgi:hypothetical protein